jgi:hypothetical protein
VLTQIEEILNSRGWISHERPYDKTILLSRGNTVGILFSNKGRASLYVKFSTSACLCDEAARWSAAHASYPWLTPHVIGHVHQPGLDMLVCEALPNSPVGRADLLEGSSAEVLRADVVRYFHSMRTAHAPVHARWQTPDQLVESMQEYFRAHPLAAVLLPMLDDGIVNRMISITYIPQSYERVYNNIY